MQYVQNTCIGISLVHQHLQSSIKDVHTERGGAEEEVRPKASAHRGKLGQLTALEKWMKN